MNKSLLMTILVTGVCTWGGFTSSVFAEDLEEYTLDQMVVTAQRTETKDLETPAAVSVITKHDLEKNGATTVMEALRRVAGVTDYSYGPGGDDLGSSWSRVYLRGFDKGALVMVNGAPINTNNYASVSGIPVNTIERIEVVKGANSVLYGAEAMGGVINIITKKGDGKLRTTVSATGGNYLNKYSVTTQAEGVIVTVGKDYLDKFEHAQMDRPAKDSYRVNEKYKRTTAFTSLALSPNLQFNWNYSKIDPMYGQRNLSTGEISGTRYRYKDTKHAASMIYTDTDNQTKTTLAYNNKKVQAENVNPDGSYKRGGHTSNFNVSNIYVDSQKKWDIGKADSLIAGLTMKHEKYDQLFANAADNNRNSYGAYISYNKRFNDKFSAVLGLRGETYRHTDFESNDNNVLLPQIQTLYKLNDTLSWYINVGKAFEMPAVNAHTTSMANIEVIRKNGIKPEEGWTYETGLKRITGTSSTKLAVFNMDYKNKFKWKHFDWMGDNNTTIQVNTGKFENNGVELEYQKNLSDKWGYNFNATFQNPKSLDEDTGKWTQESARIQFSAGVDYTLKKFSSNLNCLVLADREVSSYRYDGNTLGTKGADHDLKNRFLLNASFTYRPTDNQYAVLSLYNLLDRDEPVSTYEYYDLPFNWTLTYNFTF